MKKSLIIIFLGFLVTSCAPVLSQEYMKQGIIDFQLSHIKSNPIINKGRLFILGGIIVNTSVTKEGTLIEALYAPVDSRGYLKGIYKEGNGRFLALYRGKDILDPLIFREKREITIAGEFIGTRKGKLGEIDYIYPFFEIKEIYLWEEIRQREYYYYPPPYHYPPWYYRNRYYYPWWWY